MPQASKLNECTERKDWKAIKSVPENLNRCPLFHGSDSAFSVYSVGPPPRSGGIRTSLTPPTTRSPKPTKSHPKRGISLRPPS